MWRAEEVSESRHPPLPPHLSSVQGGKRPEVPHLHAGDLGFPGLLRIYCRLGWLFSTMAIL